MSGVPSPLRFTAAEAYTAYEEWGCNCGPTAIAAVLGMTLDEVRPHLGDFESKRYTNPLLMYDILRRLNANWALVPTRSWPGYGLARVQWEGPWTEPGVPARAAYRHTHWVGACSRHLTDVGIFDCNAMESGGWIGVGDWAGVLVPWLLKQVAPKANGRWGLTHAIEVRL